MNYLTTNEAAKSLHVTARRVRQLCQVGELDAEKISRDWLIPRKSVEEYHEKYILNEK